MMNDGRPNNYLIDLYMMLHILASVPWYVAFAERMTGKGRVLGQLETEKNSRK